MNKFWMVYIDYQAAPERRHGTEEEAHAEARRLCEKEQKTAFVLEVVHAYKYIPIPQTTFKIESEKLS